MILVKSLLLLELASSVLAAEPQAKGYKIQCVGQCDSFQPTNVQPAIGMFGGAMAPGETVASDGALYTWLVGRSNKGDAVVITADSGCQGSDWSSYGKFFLGFGSRSATSICFEDQMGAEASEVIHAVQNAALVFATGGDQSLYYKYWKNSTLSRTIDRRMQAGELCFGGESAGLAIQGKHVYAALTGSVASSDALQDPTEKSITLVDDLFSFPVLGNVITDTHFMQRDRMGRLVAFLARLYNSNRHSDSDSAKSISSISSLPSVLGVGIAEHTGLLLDLASGSAIVAGVGPVNIVQLCDQPSVLEKLHPLSATPYAALSLEPKSSFHGFNASLCHSDAAQAGYIMQVVKGNLTANGCDNVYTCGN